MLAPERLSLDAYVVDSLMPDLVGHDRRASAFVLFMYLWRRTRGGSKASVVSHSMMADGTGLARRSVQLAFDWLRRRGLVEVKRASKTAASTVRLRCHWHDRRAP